MLTAIDERAAWSSAKGLDPGAITAHLQAHGIEAGEVVTRYGALGNGPSIYIDDPEGNTVELKGPPQTS